jgi:hypothetical protein
MSSRWIRVQVANLLSFLGLWYLVEVPYLESWSDDVSSVAVDGNPKKNNVSCLDPHMNYLGNFFWGYVKGVPDFSKFTRNREFSVNKKTRSPHQLVFVFVFNYFCVTIVMCWCTYIRYLKQLFTSQDDDGAKYFRENTRYFNSHFSFTTLEFTLDCRVSTSVGAGVYTFHACGGWYHALDDLVPADHGPRHLQL